MPNIFLRFSLSLFFFYRRSLIIGNTHFNYNNRFSLYRRDYIHARLAIYQYRSITHMYINITLCASTNVYAIFIYIFFYRFFFSFFVCHLKIISCYFHKERRFRSTGIDHSRTSFHSEVSQVAVGRHLQRKYKCFFLFFFPFVFCFSFQLHFLIFIFFSFCLLFH